jgi:hypothetical protein
MGCPGATIVFEELIQLRCKKSRVGTCGGLDPNGALGDLIVALSAVPGRLDGDAPGTQAPLPDRVLVAAPRSSARREAQRHGGPRRPDCLQRPLLQPRSRPVRPAGRPAARRQTALQVQVLDAEQKKLELGASTVFQVIQFQNQLLSAQQSEVAAQVSYATSKLALDVAIAD